MICSLPFIFLLFVQTMLIDAQLCSHTSPFRPFFIHIIIRSTRIQSRRRCFRCAIYSWKSRKYTDPFSFDSFEALINVVCVGATSFFSIGGCSDGGSSSSLLMPRVVNNRASPILFDQADPIINGSCPKVRIQLPIPSS